MIEGGSYTPGTEGGVDPRPRSPEGGSIKKDDMEVLQKAIRNFFSSLEERRIKMIGDCLGFWGENHIRIFNEILKKYGEKELSSQLGEYNLGSRNIPIIDILRAIFSERRLEEGVQGFKSYLNLPTKPQEEGIQEEDIINMIEEALTRFKNWLAPKIQELQ